jgi:hypothetical protein
VSATFYYEAKLASALGLKRDELKFVRGDSLQKNLDWQMRGRDVVLSESGLAALKNYLGLNLNGVDLSGCAVEPDPQKNGAPAVLADLVVKIVYANPRLLLATTTADDGASREVRVRVKNNLNFRPRMTIKARQIGPDLYQQEGRCPRFPGRY